MGLEGITSKKLTSLYRSGKCNTWVKLRTQKTAGYLRGCDEVLGMRTNGESTIFLVSDGFGKLGRAYETRRASRQ
jgi:hypothetical protein